MGGKKETLIQSLHDYFNPFARLGTRRYSILLPAAVTLSAAVIEEFVVTRLFISPSLRSLIAIGLFIFLIVYFSLRDGVRGGVLTATITILYYFYITYTRDQTLTTATLNTIIVFAFAYYSIATVIGWLRQSMDNLIQKELDWQKRLNAIVEQLPVGIIITDKKGTIELANKNAGKILGTDIPVGRPVGEEPLVNVTHQGNPGPSPKEFITSLLKSNKPLLNQEYVIKRKDGKTNHVQIDADVIHNHKGEVIATASILNDITEKKEMDLRKDDFINMASHELKTPLTSMRLYIDTMAANIDSNHNGKTKKILKGIKTQTDRLQKLVSELLDVSRMQSGKLTYSKEPFEVETLIRETVKTTELPKKLKRIKYNSRTSTLVNADKFRISQVLHNLFNNALKYSPTDTVIIVKSKINDSKVIISVQDFGIGISKYEHKKIFDRLYQAGGEKEKTFPGLGMGLYIAKEIISEHKGKIWVESNKGKGSTFYFSLPVIKS